MRRVVLIVGLVVLHLAVYAVTTPLAAHRAATRLYEVALPIDDAIPHLPWTWPLYWLVWPYVVLGGVVLTGRGQRLSRTAGLFGALIVAGGALHVALPVRAPWPAEPHPVQVAFHAAPFVAPYGAWPSMHVALCALVALECWERTRARLARAAHVAVPLLVAVSTVTLHEHYVSDVVSGALLAGLVAAAWRLAERRSHAARPIALSPALVGGGQRDDLAGADAALQPRL